jgi:hypothetical protein
MKRRKEQEAAKAANAQGLGKLSSAGSGDTPQERLGRISDQIGAEKRTSNSPGKPQKTFETVKERLKRLNEARARSKMRNPVEV